MATMREQNQTVTREDAAGILRGEELPGGYMRAVVAFGQLGWLRHLKVSGVFIFTPVDSFPAGVGMGTLRKMVY